MSDPFAEFDALVKELESGLERTRPGAETEEPKRRSAKAVAARWEQVWFDDGHCGIPR